MIDSYLKSKNKESLEALQASVVNMIPVGQGRAESTITLEDGSTETIPACGDPDYFYTCVRAVFPVPAFDDIELCDPVEGEAVVGVWA